MHQLMAVATAKPKAMIAGRYATNAVDPAPRMNAAIA